MFFLTPAQKSKDKLKVRKHSTGPFSRRWSACGKQRVPARRLMSRSRARPELCLSHPMPICRAGGKLRLKNLVILLAVCRRTGTKGQGKTDGPIKRRHHPRCCEV